MGSKLQDRLKNKTKEIDRTVEPIRQEAPTADANAPAAIPAAPSAAPRPVSMPGQLGAFRVEAKKYLDSIAEKDAEIEALRNSTDRVQSIPLSLVDDSPYQPRLEYDPEEIDSLAKTMAVTSQADPIKVRKVEGRYELISGHRRKRAAISLGWDEISAIVEVRDDAEAEVEAMLLVTGNVKLSDWEYAKMYARALAKGYAKTQTEAAHMFSTLQPMVSGCLAMLELPAPIIEMLDAKPSLFGYDCGKTIKKLVNDHPKHLDIIVKGVRRLSEEGAKQSALKGWVLQAISQKEHKAVPRDDKRTITNEGRTVFTTKKDAKSLTVNFKAKSFDAERFEKDLHQWLAKYAEGIDSAPKPGADK